MLTICLANLLFRYSKVMAIIKYRMTTKSYISLVASFSSFSKYILSKYIVSMHLENIVPQYNQLVRLPKGSIIVQRQYRILSGMIQVQIF